MIHVVFLFCVALLLAPCADAAVWYVDRTATGGARTGASWKDAFLTVQAGLDAAANGDEVWVAAGRYNEIRNLSGVNPFGSINLKAGVALYGGFQGNEGAREQRDVSRFETILDGANGRGGGVTAYNVVFGAEQARIDGFTIVNGRAIGSANNREQRGGGLYAFGVSMTIANCRIENNRANIAGGGIFFGDNQYNVMTGAGPATTKSILLVDSRITGNTCRGTDGTASLGQGLGGGIATERANPVFQRCVIADNAARYGGGLFLQWAQPGPTVANSLIVGNTADQRGGGIYLQNAEAEIVFCTIAKNHAQQILPSAGPNFGGGCVNENRATLPVTGGVSVPVTTPRYMNCIIRDNTDTSATSNVEQFVNQTTTPISPSVVNCNIGPKSYASALNIVPLFADAANRDYRYLPGSFGINDGAGADTNPDLRGLLRDGFPDIGCYEFSPAAPVQSDFDATPTFVRVGDSVRFTNLSRTLLFGTPSIPLFSWAFGDGGTSAANNPIHVYTLTGTYTVSLSVTTPLGASRIEGTDTEIKLAYIVVGDLPVPDFTAERVLTYVGQAVSFSDRSDARNLPISNWAWDLDGDGNTDDASAAPVFAYNEPGDYTVALTVTNAAGSTTAQKPNFIAVRNPVRLTDPPPTTSAVNGSSAIVSVTPTGGFAPYNLRWQFFNTNTGAWQGLLSGPLAGQPNSPFVGSAAKAENVTSASLRLDAVDTLVNGLRVRCEGTDSQYLIDFQTGGRDVSEATELRVGGPLRILEQPSPASRYIGDLINLQVVAVGGSSVSENYQYAWRRNGSPVPGDLGLATLNVPLTEIAQEGLYSVIIADPFPVGNNDSITSNAVSVTVRAPVSVSLPTRLNLDNGDVLRVSAEVTGGYLPYSKYQWFKNGVPLQNGDDGGDISILGASLVRTGLEADDSGSYTVSVTDAVTNGSGSVGRSNSLVVSVGGATAFSAQLPDRQYAYTDTAVTISAEVFGGTPSYTYVWRRAGEVIAGAPSDSPELGLGLVSMDDAGSYTVDVIDADGASVSSNILTLFVAVPPVLSPIADQSGIAGVPISLTAQVSGGYPPYRFTWLREGVELTSSTSAQIQILESSPNLPDGILYSVSVSDAGAGTEAGSTSDRTPSTSASQNFRVTVAPGTEGPPHSADINGDFVFSLTELLRVIQIFNSGGYHCAVEPIVTYDGYVPGSNPELQTCTPHSSDFENGVPNWRISLVELLRAVQFYNVAGYRPCPENATSPDGYCPGASQAKEYSAPLVTHHGSF